MHESSLEMAKTQNLCEQSIEIFAESCCQAQESLIKKQIKRTKHLTFEYL
jgi:hypothetical protein